MCVRKLLESCTLFQIFCDILLEDDFSLIHISLYQELLMYLHLSSVLSSYG